MPDNPPITIGQFLSESTERLRNAGIESSRLDCLILLEDELETNRANILAHMEQALTEKQIVRLNSAVKRRTNREPLSYIRHKVEFYGREFHVSKNVLTPRPETEGIIELLLNNCLELHSDNQYIYVADVGTGSGCIGITVAIELPKAKVDLYDIDKDALDVAVINANIYETRLNIYNDDLLTNANDRKYDIIVTNLPYVPKNQTLSEEATFEPEHAIFSGSDGLDLYRKFWQQIRELKSHPTYIISESQPDQHNDMDKIAQEVGYKLIKTSNFAQLFKLN
jgi:release factor glutamine methyltransferase